MLNTFISFSVNSVKSASGGKTKISFRVMKGSFLALALVASPFFSYAQLNVTTTNNAMTLANEIVGNGVMLVSASLNGGGDRSGIFTYNGGFPISSSGILLTTGRASCADEGCSSSCNGSACANPGGCCEDNGGLCSSINGGSLGTLCGKLNTIAGAGGNVIEGTILTLKIIPSCNTLEIPYVFGSEEFPEWIPGGDCALTFNDPFGIFISGDIPAGGCSQCGNGIYQRYTVSSTTAREISINNMGSHVVAYDGVVSKTGNIAVCPGKEYTIEIAVADANDGIFDAGVFIPSKILSCCEGYLVDIIPSTTKNPICEGECVNLTATCKVPGTCQFSWNTGETTQTITVCPTQNTTYSVTVTDPFCCTASASYTLNVNPISGFAIPPCIAVNTPTQFCATVQNPSFTYSWTFTGATPSSGNTACVNNVTWSTAGTYNVTLTVTDNNGVPCSATKTVTVIADAALCCEQAFTWDKTSFTATNSGMWTPVFNPINNGSGGTVFIEEELRIPAGKTIMIQGMKIEFGVQGRLIVEQNAALNLDNTTLTGNTFCNTMWEGVQVLGDPNQSQNSTIQGKLTLRNQSVIEHARTSVQLGQIIFIQIGPITIPIPANGGGIIDARNSIFRDNNVAVSFFPYIDNNGIIGSSISAFRNCIFESTQPLRDAATYAGRGSALFIGMTAIDQVTIEDNIFRNTYIKDPGLRTTDGIVSRESNYNVKAQTAGNQFSNLRRTIYSTVSLPGLESAHVFSGNIFDEVQTAIRIEGGFDDEISGNTFNPDGTTPCDPDNADCPNFYGVFLLNTQGFVIKDNVFNDYNYGIYCDGSGGLETSPPSDIHDNDFNGCWRGNHLAGSNTNMEIKCNNYIDYTSSAWVLDASASLRDRQGVAQQGYCNLNDATTPAGNEFFHTLGGSDIFSSSWAFTYNHHSAPLPQIIPSVHTANVILNNCSVDKDATSCNSNIPPRPVILIKKDLAEETNPNRRMVFVMELIRVRKGAGQINELIQDLEGLDDTAVKWLLVPTYIRRGEFTKAEQLLYTLPADNEEAVNRAKYYQVWIALGKDGKSIFEMTAEQHSAIHGVCSTNTMISANAKSTCMMVFGETFPYTWVSDTTGGRMANINMSEDNSPKESVLYDNVPNPFSDKSFIKYYLPQSAGNAEIALYDLTGRKVVTYNNLNTGYGTVEVRSGLLNSGMYIYIMQIDKKVIDRKKMIILK